MIRVKVRPGKVLVNGHAMAAEHGKDIVCSAVTMLTMNLIQSILSLTEDKIEYEIETGCIQLRYEKNLSEVSKTLIDSFFIGICMMSESYPENVRIE